MDERCWSIPLMCCCGVVVVVVVVVPVVVVVVARSSKGMVCWDDMDVFILLLLYCFLSGYSTLFVVVVVWIYYY